jgi:hypothetical protein
VRLFAADNKSDLFFTYLEVHCRLLLFERLAAAARCGRNNGFSTGETDQDYGNNAYEEFDRPVPGSANGNQTLF